MRCISCCGGSGNLASSLTLVSEQFGPPPNCGPLGGGHQLPPDSASQARNLLLALGLNLHRTGLPLGVRSYSLPDSASQARTIVIPLLSFHSIVPFKHRSILSLESASHKWPCLPFGITHLPFDNPLEPARLPPISAFSNVGQTQSFLLL